MYMGVNLLRYVKTFPRRTRAASRGVNLIAELNRVRCSVPRKEPNTDKFCQNCMNVVLQYEIFYRYSLK